MFDACALLLNHWTTPKFLMASFQKLNVILGLVNGTKMWVTAVDSRYVWQSVFQPAKHMEGKLPGLRFCQEAGEWVKQHSWHLGETGRDRVVFFTSPVHL